MPHDLLTFKGILPNIDLVLFFYLLLIQLLILQDRFSISTQSLSNKILHYIKCLSSILNSYSYLKQTLCAHIQVQSHSDYHIFSTFIIRFFFLYDSQFPLQAGNNFGLRNILLNFSQFPGSCYKEMFAKREFERQLWISVHDFLLYLKILNLWSPQLFLDDFEIVWHHCFILTLSWICVPVYLPLPSKHHVLDFLLSIW